MNSAPGSVDTRDIVTVCRSSGTLDQTLLREMLECFLRENERRVRRSQHAVVHGDRAMLRQLAHAVRGSAAMLGAGRLHDLAWSLEMDADRTALPLLGRAVSELRAEFEAVTASLRKAHPGVVDHGADGLGPR